MEKSYAEQVAEAKERISEISARDVKDARAKGSDAVIVDVREAREYNLGRIPDAVFIPLGELESRADREIPRDRQVIVYCARGNRSAIGADLLQKKGFGDVKSMAGGWFAWVDAGGDVEG
jgi:rhodanese-related sulfurtransferase